ncbi:MAG: alpha/beta fold hydrolase [Rhodanobacter sp.]
MPRHLSRHQYLHATDGCRLAYRDGGPADGNVVILLHGMAGTSDTWDGVARALIAGGHRVIALDLRGHGRSARAASYPLPDFSTDVITLLDHLALAQVDLIGHSLGGFVALSVAALQPQRVRRLLIEDVPTPLRDKSDASKVRSVPSVRRLLASMGIRRMLAIAFTNRFDLRMRKPILAALSTPTPAWWASLAAIRAPTLLLGATQSHLSAERLPLLANAIPHSTLRTLDGGHRLHTEQPAAFLDAALPFLGN